MADTVRENKGKPTWNILDKTIGDFTNRAALDAKNERINISRHWNGNETGQYHICRTRRKSMGERHFQSSNSHELSNAVFFYTSKVFGLRSDNEHRNLRVTQFEFGENANGRFVQFNGGACKTKSG